MRDFINKINTLHQRFSANNDNVELLRASVIIFMLKVLFAVSGFLSSVLIARYLPVEDAGSYFFMISVVLLLSTISRSGLDSAITRYIALANTLTQQRANSTDEVVSVFSYSLRRALFGGVIASLCWAICYFGYSAFYGATVNELLLGGAVILIVPLTSTLVVFAQSFQGLKQAFLFASVGGGVSFLLLLQLSLLLLALSLTGIQQSFSVVYLVCCYIVALITMLVFAWRMWKRLFPFLQYRAERPLDITQFDQSCQQLWGIACLAIMMAQGAQILIGLLSDGEQVAYFAVASRIALLVAFVLLAVNGALSPKFSELDAVHDKDRLEAIYRSSTAMMLIIAVPVLLIMFVFSAQILSIFGDNYQQALTTVRILIAAQFIKVAVGSVGQLLIMSGYERSQRNILFFAVVILILSAICLIPLFGAIGGAWAVFLAVTTNNLLGLYMVHAKLNISLFSLTALLKRT